MRQQRSVLFFIICVLTAMPLCGALVDSSGQDGAPLIDGHHQVLQNAFHEILNRRRRDASDLVVSVEFDKKENKSISELSQKEKDFLLHVHNAYRSAVQPFAANMLEVVWDDSIAAFAQDWANQCTAEHRPKRDLSPWINMGENIYWVYSGRYHEGLATKFWWDEVQWYNHSTMECVPDQMCGHYVTMVWAATARIGCGVNRCSRLLALQDIGRGAYYFVCNYSGRFYSNTRPYREHNTMCSRCFQTSAPKCRYNLCVTQEMLDYDIGYNGSTAEIGLNRTRTSSSLKSSTTKVTTVATTPTSFNTTNTTSSDTEATSPTSPETSTQTSFKTSPTINVTSPETETSVSTSTDTTTLTSPNTTNVTPTDTDTSSVTSETSEITSPPTVTTTFVSSDISTISTITVNLSTMSSMNTTSYITSPTMTASVPISSDTIETTIKYDIEDKPFILLAVDEIMARFNSGSRLSMFSLQTFAGIAILVSCIMCN